MSDCRYGSGDVVYGRDLHRLLAEDCVLEEGATIVLFYDDDGSADGGSGLSKSLEVPTRLEPPVRHKFTKEIIMEDTAPNGSGVLPVPAPVTAPAQSIASVEHPVAAPIDVNALVGATGGNGGIAIALAMIAVLFGAAGWKFWTKISEQHHELKMKELEMKAAAHTDKSPQQCTTAHAAFEARIAALESKVAVVEKSSLSLGDSFDPDLLDKRLDKIEKQLKIGKRA